MKLQAYDAEKKLVTKSQRKSLSVRVVCMSYIVMHGMCLVGKVAKFLEFRANVGIQDIYKSLLKILEDLQKKKMFTNIFYK